MEAVILHTRGDEILAEGIAAKIAPAESFNASLRADAGLTFGDQLTIFAIWSAKAEADGLAPALTRVAGKALGRCIVVRADGTPLPALSPATRVVASSAARSEFEHLMAAARGAAPTVSVAPRMRSSIGAWAPGVSIGFAIYAGMFVAAGAWRGAEVTDALTSGKAVPLASALHSFQVAVNTATDTVRISEARAEPSVRFVTPQRVVLTAALDSSGAVPFVAASQAAAVPLSQTAPALSLRLFAVDDQVESVTYAAPVAAVRLIPVAAIRTDEVLETSPGALKGVNNLSSLEMRGSEPF